MVLAARCAIDALAGHAVRDASVHLGRVRRSPLLRFAPLFVCVRTVGSRFSTVIEFDDFSDKSFRAVQAPPCNVVVSTILRTDPRGRTGENFTDHLDIVSY